MMSEQRGNTKFLVSELIKRDFIKRYKRTSLGQLWNILSPLLLLLVMDVVYSQLFSGRMSHYTTFLFAGYIHYNFFNSSTSGALHVFQNSAYIFNKVRVNKLYFLLSANATHIVTYACMLVINVIFMVLDGVPLSFRLVCLLYPMLCEILISYAVGLIVATIFVFFQDIRYIYPVLMRVLMYISGVFYRPEILPEVWQNLLWVNPIYPSVYFTRVLMLEQRIPDFRVWLYLALMAAALGMFSLILFQRTEKKFYLYL